MFAPVRGGSEEAGRKRPLYHVQLRRLCEQPPAVAGTAVRGEKGSVYRGPGTAGTAGDRGGRNVVSGRGAPPSRGGAGDAVYLYR